MKRVRVSKRRRKENKTDYGKRFKLLKSGSPRVVFRKTNTQLIVQYVTSDEAQDKVEFGLSSEDLIKYGWPEKSKSSLKSTTAAYFLGYLVGKKISSKKLDKPVTDFGMIRMITKSKVYGFIKGMIDSGIDLKCDEGVFPDESRIKGEHLKTKVDFDKIKSNIEND